MSTKRCLWAGHPANCTGLLISVTTTGQPCPNDLWCKCIYLYSSYTGFTPNAVLDTPLFYTGFEPQ